MMSLTPNQALTGSRRLPACDRPAVASVWVTTGGLGDATRVNRRHAFTLLEMLLALSISAIVLVGIGGVFFSAMRLRERTAALLDASGSLYQTLAILRRDLQGTLPPGGLMAWDFKCGAVNSAVGQVVGLQFSTTTGIIKDDSPWGDIQQVTYELRDPVVRTNSAGKDLVRTVTRNLLSTTTPDYHEQSLLSNVERMEITCFDGMQWRELWDTSLTDTNVPSAVRLRLHLVGAEDEDRRQRQPFEMVIPLVTQSRTNQTQQASGGAQ
jgi:general secretion pathway protein J